MKDRFDVFTAALKKAVTKRDMTEAELEEAYLAFAPTAADRARLAKGWARVRIPLGYALERETRAKSVTIFQVLEAMDRIVAGHGGAAS